MENQKVKQTPSEVVLQREAEDRSVLPVSLGLLGYATGKRCSELIATQDDEVAADRQL